MTPEELYLRNSCSTGLSTNDVALQDYYDMNRPSPGIFSVTYDCKFLRKRSDCKPTTNGEAAAAHYVLQISSRQAYSHESGAPRVRSSATPAGVGTPACLLDTAITNVLRRHVTI